MSNQSLGYWNGSEMGDRVLVGYCDLHKTARKGASYTTADGRPWWYKTELQGAEPNIYMGPVPVGDVTRRLFNFDWLEVPVGVQTPDGVWVPQGNRKAIAASDNFEVVGMFKEGYQPHGFGTWLLGEVANLLGGEVGIGSAGFPTRDRSVAWVQVRTPEWVTTPEGVEFLPWILAASSANGTLATTYSRAATFAVCDNSLTAAVTEGGAKVRVKHTRYSHLKLGSAKETLGLIEETAESVSARVAELCGWNVTDLQFGKVIDKLVVAGDTQRSKTIADTKVSTIKGLYRSDPRCAPWKGTAFGVLQAFDTFERHYATVRGVSRPERNLMGTIDGSYDAVDQQVLKTLASVCS